MRIVESVVKYSLLFVLLSSSLYIFSFGLWYIPNEMTGEVPEVNEYILFGCLLIAALFTFISPMYNVGGYLKTSDIQKIKRFVRKEKEYFGMLVFGFFAAMCLCSEFPSFLWWTGAVLIVFFFFWLFFFRKQGE